LTGSHVLGERGAVNLIYVSGNGREPQRRNCNHDGCRTAGHTIGVVIAKAGSVVVVGLTGAAG
jgi:hypothetical protein